MGVRSGRLRLLAAAKPKVVGGHFIRALNVKFTVDTKETVTRPPP
jgi:hypothetical protein